MSRVKAYELTQPTTYLDFQINADPNDGIVINVNTEGVDGTFSADSGNAYLGIPVTKRAYSFFRFTGITIPAGAHITKAYLEMKARVSSGITNPCNVKFYANDAAAPAAPISTGQFWALARSTNVVEWSAVPEFVIDNWYRSPNISSLVQELVDSYAYANGAMQFMIWDNGSLGAGGRDIRAGALNYGNDMKLHIEYIMTRLDLPFIEGAGNKLNDISGKGINFSLTGPPTWQSLAFTPVKQVLNFNGVNQYLQCPAADSLPLNITSQPFTILAWVYGVGGGGADMIICQNGTDVCGWALYVFWMAPNGTLALRTNQLGAHTEVSAVDALTPNQWHHIAVTRNGAAGQFYVDGVPVTTIGALTDPVSPAGTKKALIGVQDGEVVNFWEGKIGKVLFVENALSEILIRNDMERDYSKYH